VAENVYLKGLREQYTSLQKSIEGYQTRAVEAKRDLTEDELRTVKEQGEKAKALYTQIEDLTEIETRNAKVAKMQADIAAAMSGADGTGSIDNDDAQFRSVGNTGGAKTQDRDPGHYRSVKAGGTRSFFSDLYRSKAFSDEAAAKRLVEHSRALSTGSQGVGVVPPKWLTEEFELLARQGRALAAAVRNIPLGDDPRPMTLPKQTAGTDAQVAEQASENDPVGGADAWDSDVDTVTPKPTSGKQTVSRQMVDMSSPAIDTLIYGDLLSVYDLKVENKVGAAVRAVGASLGTITKAQFADMSVDDTNGIDMAIDAAMAVRGARKLPANILAMEVATWGRYKKLKDAAGRPIIPSSTAGPMNVAGVGEIATDGQLENLGIVVTDGMDDGVVNQETVAALRASDVLLFESNILRFRFEEVAGPESIVLGIWGYTAVIVRQGTKAVKRFLINTA
jgi:hypothetical protein